MTEHAYGKRYGRALKSAARWHRDHTRKGSGIPYVSHLLTVSALVWEDGGDETEAIAALLHDAVEDEKATLATVQEKFGKRVAAIVDDCSDAAPESGEDKAPWFGRKVHHLERLAAVDPDRVASTMRVVGADKVANIRTVLVDHRSGVPDLWNRFKGGLGGTAWYYAEMAGLVRVTLPNSMLAAELSRSVSELDRVAVEMAEAFDGAPSRISTVLADIARGDGHDATPHLAFELARVLGDNPDGQQSAATGVLQRWFGDAPVDLVEAVVVESPPAGGVMTRVLRGAKGN